MIEIQELLQSGDSFAAIESIQKTGTPLEIAARYDLLVRDLYWKAHDLPAVVEISRAGILYCLAHASAAGQPPEVADRLRGTAKGLAYNAASFAWPGWQEPGIDPTPEQIAYGHNCARLNFRLAKELKRPPLVVSRAHWVVGAYALSSAEFDIAARQFQFAQSLLTPGDSAAGAEILCTSGYVAMAKLCENPSDAVAEKSFSDTLDNLASLGSEDAKSFADQLKTVRGYFLKRMQSDSESTVV
jgi:hypothetical protein